jgi:hypothetical protein
MTDQGEIKSIADRSAQVLLRLLKEYTEKLEKMRTQALSLDAPASKAAADAMERERRVAQHVFHRMEPALNDLSRQASQYVQHGGVDAATRTELRIRLAEFDATSEAVQMFGIW